jgi:hypothetical protein
MFFIQMFLSPPHFVCHGWQKIKQCVYFSFCVKLRKSATETIEMLHEAFGEHSLSRTPNSNWIVFIMSMKTMQFVDTHERDPIAKFRDCYFVTASVKEDEREGQAHISTSILHQSATCYCTVNMHCFTRVLF